MLLTLAAIGVLVALAVWAGAILLVDGKPRRKTLARHPVTVAVKRNTSETRAALEPLRLDRERAKRRRYAHYMTTKVSAEDLRRLLR